MTDLTQLNTDIDELFDDILTILTDDQLNSKTIESKFAELFQQISDLEDISYPHYVQHRYRYHKIRVAYYEKIKDETKKDKEERLLTKYETLHKQYVITETSIPKEENASQESKPPWETIHNLVASITQLQDTNQFINPLKHLQSLLKQIFQHKIQTFDEYVLLQKNCLQIENLFETLKANECDIILDEINSEESNSIQNIDEFLEFLRQGLEDCQTQFARVLLADLPELEKILFDNIPQTEQCIRQRYHQWARVFHSDRNNRNPVFDELMKYINIVRDRYLANINSSITKSEAIQTMIERAHKHAEASVALKKRLKSGDDAELTIEQLKKLILLEALNAFQYYRMALKSLGKVKSNENDILQRSQILEWMAIMMRQAGNHETEAQLYIVAAIYIITNSTMTDTLFKRLRHLQSALEKYQGLPNNTSNERSNSVARNTNRELVLCTNANASPRELSDESQMFLRETVLRKCVLRNTESKALSTDSHTIIAHTMETDVGSSVYISSTAAQVIQPFASERLMSFGIALWNMIPFTRKIPRRSVKDISEEYDIRCSLNDLIKEAVDCYNVQNYAQFITQLSKPYYADRQLMDTKLGSETISIEIRVNQLIQPLLDHGFRADKIAHLLILIGEVFLRGINFGDPKRSNPEYTSLLEQSKILFQGVYDNENLKKAAYELDERLQKYQRAQLKKLVKMHFDPISQQDIDDACEGCYSDRLASYCRLARLNYAIACLLAGGKDNFQRCKQSLKKLKSLESTLYDSFFSIPDERIQALEDLLSAFGMDDDDDDGSGTSDCASRLNMLTTNTELSIDIYRLEYFKTNYGYQNCNTIHNVDVDDVSQLDVLAQMVPIDHNFDCEQFIEFVTKKYSPTDQHILDLLRQQSVSDLNEWAIKFRSNPKVFQHKVYLPLLSAFGHMKIQICETIHDQEKGWVFASSYSMIDYSSVHNESRHLFVFIFPKQNHISAIFTLMPVEINHLHWQLADLSKNHPERIKVLLRIAAYYEDEAIQNDKKCHLRALVEWRKAQNFYLKILEMKDVLSKEQLYLAEIGYCKCLLKQHRYSIVTERLSNNKYKLSRQMLLIYAQAQRYLGDYKRAADGIQQAMQSKTAHMINPDFEREHRTIKLKNERMTVTQVLDLSTSFPARNKEKPFYNILSIDGGGIRGIIPAIWLMALEEKIKRPVSSIFDVVAGTSTGAIISAGLTTPSLDNPSKPRYQASDLVQLYQEKADEVFSKNTSIFSSFRIAVLKEYKYTDAGRHSLFSHYFGGTKIVDTISELLIPVVRSGSNGTDLFTRHTARKDMTKNGLLTEILMCTSAAPTFFPPYNIKGTIYVDGGVQANNPSMHAYDHTLQIYPNCDRNRIRLLSLGTGDCVLDPLNPQDSRNLLFWLRNNRTIRKVVMDGPQNNVDLHLNNILGDNYYRWQVWFENPIKLDDIEESSINRMIDLAYGHLEEMEAYDNRQRLGCLVEDLRSTF